MHEYLSRLTMVELNTRRAQAAQETMSNCVTKLTKSKLNTRRAETGLRSMAELNRCK